jgi:acetylornithine deacetylase/succinyl-diaminopimelate desuccinylase-like protein
VGGVTRGPGPGVWARRRGRWAFRRGRWAFRRGAWATTVPFAGMALAYLTNPAAAQLSPERIEALVEGEAVPSIALFREYLGLPNDGHFPEDIDRLLHWLEGAFSERGFTTERLETDGNELLFAERHVANPAATVLVYLQADGQPVDRSEWSQESPYQAALMEIDAESGAQSGTERSFREISWDRLAGGIDEDWRIFARSASDSKGPNIQFLKAWDLMEEAGVEPDYDVKVIIDTMEEMGSPVLPAAIERYSDKLAADMLIIFDGPPHYSGRPSLKFGARGIATFTLTTYGPRAPQHSGHYGNYAPNPGIRLAQILASMKTDDGRVTIPGFYDGIEIDEATRRILEAVPDDEAEVMERLGISEIDAVADNLQEAVQWPSLNVRGLQSGWVGEQARTIVPATAMAEVDIRLVRETDGERLLGLVRVHIEGLGYYVISDRDPTEEERRTEGRIARFDSRVSYAAFRTDFDSEPGRWLSAGMVNLFGEEPVKIRTSGGSIPISPFVSLLGIPAVTVPTVNPDNNQHSPNENLRVGSFLDGISIAVAVLSQPLRPFVTVH